MNRSKEQIKESYARALQSAQSKNAVCSATCAESSCAAGCDTAVKGIPSFGSTANLVKKAKVKKGDVVVDFGSGPGHDLLESAQIVGEKGRAIGVDLTPEMVEYAIEEAKKLSLGNVEVHLADIEKVPIESNIADVVISNCVINLTTNKQAVFKEAYRILKPGGRLVDADIIADKELPKNMKQDKDLWCGCVSGASTKEGYIDAIKKAGFTDISVNIEQSGNITWKNEELLMHSGIITAIKPKSKGKPLN